MSSKEVGGSSDSSDEEQNENDFEIINFEHEPQRRRAGTNEKIGAQNTQMASTSGAIDIDMDTFVTGATGNSHGSAEIKESPLPEEENEGTVDTSETTPTASASQERNDDIAVELDYIIIEEEIPSEDEEYVSAQNSGVTGGESGEEGRGETGNVDDNNHPLTHDDSSDTTSDEESINLSGSRSGSDSGTDSGSESGDYDTGERVPEGYRRTSEHSHTLAMLTEDTEEPEESEVESNSTYETMQTADDGRVSSTGPELEDMTHSSMKEKVKQGNIDVTEQPNSEEIGKKHSDRRVTGESLNVCTTGGLPDKLEKYTDLMPRNVEVVTTNESVIEPSTERVTSKESSADSKATTEQISNDMNIEVTNVNITRKVNVNPIEDVGPKVDHTDHTDLYTGESDLTNEIPITQSDIVVTQGPSEPKQHAQLLELPDENDTSSCSSPTQQDVESDSHLASAVSADNDHDIHRTKEEQVESVRPHIYANDVSTQQTIEQDVIKEPDANMTLEIIPSSDDQGSNDSLSDSYSFSDTAGSKSAQETTSEPDLHVAELPREGHTEESVQEAMSTLKGDPRRSRVRNRKSGRASPSTEERRARSSSAKRRYDWNSTHFTPDVPESLIDGIPCRSFRSEIENRTSCPPELIEKDFPLDNASNQVQAQVQCSLGNDASVTEEEDGHQPRGKCTDEKTVFISHQEKDELSQEQTEIEANLVSSLKTKFEKAAQTESPINTVSTTKTRIISIVTGTHTKTMTTSSIKNSRSPTSESTKDASDSPAARPTKLASTVTGRSGIKMGSPSGGAGEQSTTTHNFTRSPLRQSAPQMGTWSVKKSPAPVTSGTQVSDLEQKMARFSELQRRHRALQSSSSEDVTSPPPPPPPQSDLHESVQDSLRRYQKHSRQHGALMHQKPAHRELFFGESQSEIFIMEPPANTGTGAASDEYADEFLVQMKKRLRAVSERGDGRSHSAGDGKSESPTRPPRSTVTADPKQHKSPVLQPTNISQKRSYTKTVPTSSPGTKTQQSSFANAGGGVREWEEQIEIFPFSPPPLSVGPEGGGRSSSVASRGSAHTPTSPQSGAPTSPRRALDAKTLVAEERKKFEEYKREYVRRHSSRYSSGEEISSMDPFSPINSNREIPPDEYEYVLRKIHTKPVHTQPGNNSVPGGTQLRSAVSSQHPLCAFQWHEATPQQSAQHHRTRKYLEKKKHHHEHYEGSLQLNADTVTAETGSQWEQYGGYVQRDRTERSQNSGYVTTEQDSYLQRQQEKLRQRRSSGDNEGWSAIRGDSSERRLSHHSNVFEDDKDMDRSQWQTKSPISPYTYGGGGRQDFSDVGIGASQREAGDAGSPWDRRAPPKPLRSALKARSMPAVDNPDEATGVGSSREQYDYTPESRQLTARAHMPPTPHTNFPGSPQLHPTHSPGGGGHDQSTNETWNAGYRTYSPQAPYNTQPSFPEAGQHGYDQTLYGNPNNAGQTWPGEGEYAQGTWPRQSPYNAPPINATYPSNIHDVSVASAPDNYNTAYYPGPDYGATQPPYTENRSTYLTDTLYDVHHQSPYRELDQRYLSPQHHRPSGHASPIHPATQNLPADPHRLSPARRHLSPDPRIYSPHHRDLSPYREDRTRHMSASPYQQRDHSPFGGSAHEPYSSRSQGKSDKTKGNQKHRYVREYVPPDSAERVNQRRNKQRPSTHQPSAHASTHHALQPPHQSRQPTASQFPYPQPFNPYYQDAHIYYNYGTSQQPQAVANGNLYGPYSEQIPSQLYSQQSQTSIGQQSNEKQGQQTITDSYNAPYITGKEEHSQQNDLMYGHGPQHHNKPLETIAPPGLSLHRTDYAREDSSAYGTDLKLDVGDKDARRVPETTEDGRTYTQIFPPPADATVYGLTPEEQKVFAKALGDKLLNLRKSDPKRFSAHEPLSSEPTPSAAATQYEEYIRRGRSESRTDQQPSTTVADNYVDPRLIRSRKDGGVKAAAARARSLPRERPSSQAPNAGFERRAATTQSMRQPTSPDRKTRVSDVVGIRPARSVEDIVNYVEDIPQGSVAKIKERLFGPGSEAPDIPIKPYADPFLAKSTYDRSTRTPSAPQIPQTPIDASYRDSLKRARPQIYDTLTDLENTYDALGFEDEAGRHGQPEVNVKRLSISNVRKFEELLQRHISANPSLDYAKKWLATETEDEPTTGQKLPKDGQHSVRSQACEQMPTKTPTKTLQSRPVVANKTTDSDAKYSKPDERLMSYNKLPSRQTYSCTDHQSPYQTQRDSPLQSYSRNTTSQADAKEPVVKRMSRKEEIRSRYGSSVETTKAASRSKSLERGAARQSIPIRRSGSLERPSLKPNSLKGQKSLDRGVAKLVARFSGSTNEELSRSAPNLHEDSEEDLFGGQYNSYGDLVSADPKFKHAVKPPTAVRVKKETPRIVKQRSEFKSKSKAKSGDSGFCPESGDSGDLSSGTDDTAGALIDGGDGMLRNTNNNQRLDSDSAHSSPFPSSRSASSRTDLHSAKMNFFSSSLSTLTGKDSGPESPRYTASASDVARNKEESTKKYVSNPLSSVQLKQPSDMNLKSSGATTRSEHKTVAEQSPVDNEKHAFQLKRESLRHVRAPESPDDERPTVGDNRSFAGLGYTSPTTAQCTIATHSPVLQSPGSTPTPSQREVPRPASEMSDFDAQLQDAKERLSARLPCISSPSKSLSTNPISTSKQSSTQPTPTKSAQSLKQARPMSIDSSSLHSYVQKSNLSTDKSTATPRTTLRINVQSSRSAAKKDASSPVDSPERPAVMRWSESSETVKSNRSGTSRALRREEHSVEKNTHEQGGRVVTETRQRDVQIVRMSRREVIPVGSAMPELTDYTRSPISIKHARQNSRDLSDGELTDTTDITIDSLVRANQSIPIQTRRTFMHESDEESYPLSTRSQQKGNDTATGSSDDTTVGTRSQEGVTVGAVVLRRRQEASEYRREVKKEVKEERRLSLKDRVKLFEDQASPLMRRPRVNDD